MATFNPAEVIIYHNPRCSKSRQTLALLEQQGIAPQIIDYLKTPPSTVELAEILTRLQLEPRAIMRQQEVPYQEANLGQAELTHEQLLQTIVDHPILLQRPIVIANDKAAIGRPPAAVLSIL